MCPFCNPFFQFHVLLSVTTQAWGHYGEAWKWDHFQVCTQLVGTDLVTKLCPNLATNSLPTPHTQIVVSY